MIELSHITKRYGPKLAASDISFTAEKGEILGLLGRNGAGKSTILNILTGYLAPTSGTVRVDGHDMLVDASLAKRNLGYLPEVPPLYVDMTVEEYLRFACRIKGILCHAIPAQVESALTRMDLCDVRGRLIRNLSKGYRQRVGMAQALLGEPDVLVLDEPTVGLDPMQILDMRGLIRSLGEAHTVVLSSHILHEVAEVCDRVVILSEGRVVASDTVANLTRVRAPGSTLRVRAAIDSDTLAAALAAIPGVASAEPLPPVELDAADVRVIAATERDLRPVVLSAVMALDAPLRLLAPEQDDFEAVFLRLTAQEGGAADAGDLGA